MAARELGMDTLASPGLVRLAKSINTISNIMTKTISIFFFTLLPYLHGFSQESRYESIVELSIDRFCDEYETETPNGKTGNFRKSELLRLSIGKEEVILQKFQNFNDIEDDYYCTKIRFKPVRILNFPVELLHLQNIEIIQNESLLPFISNRVDVNGKSISDTLRFSHSCKATLSIYYSGLAFTKEIDTDFLKKEILITNKPNLTIIENSSFDHNTNLFHIRIYDLLMGMSDRINRKNGYEIE